MEAIRCGEELDVKLSVIRKFSFPAMESFLKFYFGNEYLTKIISSVNFKI